MSKKKNKSKRTHSTLPQHKRQKKQLIPPLAEITQMQLQSWRDERLPGMLWAALVTTTSRKQYLEIFRKIGHRAESVKEGFDGFISHSHLAQLSEAEFDSLLEPALKSKDAREALRWLLFFKGLPDRHHWERHLEAPTDDEEFDVLAVAIATNLFHQSESATDIRWLRLLASIQAGRMVFNTQFEERLKEYFEYPYRGELTQVRPSIRATESSIANPELGEDNSDWNATFWRECWESTSCFSRTKDQKTAPDNSEAVDQLLKLYSAVADHFMEKTETTEFDPRKDAVFGLVLFGLNLALTAHLGPGETRAEGRLVIRTMTEVVITLSFLLKKDDETLWKKYRAYGTGQAKLAYLKIDDLEGEDVPAFVKATDLEDLANEDLWMEFQNIDLGNWAGSDLRRMSEEAGVKDLYDKYYAWPSGFVHGQWGAVRDTVYEVCLNPLHRHHRIPAAPRTDMGSVAPDSIKLCNALLDKLNFAYPTFKPRFKAIK